VEQRQIEQLSQAGRLVAAVLGTDFNQGQVSARQPSGRAFWINRSELGLDEFDADSFTTCDLERAVPSLGSGLPPEAPMHQAIYEARPDVGAIVGLR
jgi:L-fuculose-phosphate aldolase